MSDGPDPWLGYRNAADDRGGVARRAAWGAVCGVTCTAGMGFVLFCLTFELDRAPHHGWPAVAVFGGAAAGSAVGLVWLSGRWGRRTFWAGFLIAVLVVSLVEGTCFYNP